VATAEININDLLEANEAQQKASSEQREKQRQAQVYAAEMSKISAAQKKKITDTQKQIAYLESQIQKSIAAINKRKSSDVGKIQPTDDLVEQLNNIVNRYNETIKEFNKIVPEAQPTAPYEERKAGRLTTAVGTPTTKEPPPEPPADTPQGDLSSASTDTAEAADKKNIVNNVNDSADLEKLGINRAVLRYMKENYPDDYAKIKPLIDNTLSDKNLTQNELDRISVEFKKSEYYKKSTVEKYRTEIGSYFITNGLDTVTNSALIDQFTSDVYLKKTSTPETAEAEIRKLAVERLGLSTSQDTNKQRIAAAMIDGGQTFLQAAAPYIQAYATTLEIPANEFDPLSDNAFLNAFNGSTSFADFQVKVKSDPRYAMSMKGRQEMDQTKLNLQRLTRALGLGYNPQQLESQALNVVAGKTTFEQIEYSLRSKQGTLRLR